MRRRIVLSVACVLAIAGCKKKPPANEVDASAAASASAPVPTASAAETADAAPSASAAAAAEPAGTTAAKGGPSGPFTGVYACANNLTLTQSGSHVSGTTNAGYKAFPKTVGAISCAVSGNVCTGTWAETTQKALTSKPEPGKTYQLTMTLDHPDHIQFKTTSGVAFSCSRK